MNEEITRDENLSESEGMLQVREDIPNSTEYDISELLAEDLLELSELFPELSGVDDIARIENSSRYAALRDMGLSPEEAYRATRKGAPIRDSRAHLKSSVPTLNTQPFSGMTQREWREARELFEDLSDSEIEKLYKKVTR